jgi:alpha-D-xyloside xylohydrolase
VPWLFGDASVELLRYFAGLRARLMPYLLSVAEEAHEHGWPMLRAMILEFPDDPVCRHLDRQYMLGSGLLIPPVFRATGEVTYYLPAGRWRHLLTGEEAVGPGSRTETVGSLGAPIWVRAEAEAAWACLRSREAEPSVQADVSTHARARLAPSDQDRT